MSKPRKRKKKFIYLKEGRFEVTPDGLLYCPGADGSKKKHCCPDCYFCQWCSDSRCSLCRRQPKPAQSLKDHR